MEDNLQRVFAILISVIVFFLLPLYITFEKKDDISYSLALKITTNFVNNVKTKGYLSRNMYDEFISELSVTDNVYEIKLEHLSKKYYPVIYSYKKDAKGNRVVDKKFDWAHYKEQYEDKGKIKIGTDEYKDLSLEFELSQERYTEKQILEVCDRANPNIFSKMTVADYKNIAYAKIPSITNMYGNKNNSVYAMSVGDEFNVIIKNTNTTLATVLFNTLTFGANTENNTKVYINYGGVIQGEEYKNIASEILKGDVNRDGVVNIFDINKIRDYILSGTGLTDEQKEIADVNKDGKIDNKDIDLMYGI